MRNVEPEQRDDVERGKDGDGEQEEFGPDQERERVVAEVCAQFFPRPEWKSLSTCTGGWRRGEAGTRDRKKGARRRGFVSSVLALGSAKGVETYRSRRHIA